MFETVVRDGVLQVRRPGTRWLSTGWDGGFSTAPAAYNVSVPEGFARTDLAAYLAERRADAGFDDPGPALLTGVDMHHARGARSGPVETVATAGVNNPAALPMAPTGDPDPATEQRPGTVNVVLGTTRALPDGALANLVAVAAEAKAATLLHETGFPGTTSDAVVVGMDPDGDPATFSGSSTAVGAAARACVREAVRASLAARYETESPPASVADAPYGVATNREAAVFVPDPGIKVRLD
ncbi:adenosylcobinamide amidohydrolase [Halobacteriaceae archaeon GCM10025711]